MKPIDQTLFGEGTGNCFAACVASVLELSLNGMPNFCGDYPADKWWYRFQEWLQPHGLSAIELQLWVEGCDWRPNPGQLCILGGKSPRGAFDHAVVGVYGSHFRVIHDPHHSRAGIEGDFKTALFFIPLDPCR